MRIDRIDLIRFGHFSNRKIAFPSKHPDYYLVYGDNEAGKSTLLRGISALLFGVPTKTPDVHSCKGYELRIGAAISNDGKTFSFRRRKGITGTLLNLDEAQIEERDLTVFLRELDRDRFEQFFGLNHERLREGGEELLRGKGDVGSALFQAAGLLDLRNLLEGIDEEAKELFSPKSRTKVVSCALDEYKRARYEGRKLAISAATVKQKQTELEAAKETHEELKLESQSLHQELVRLRRIESNKPDVARLQELRAALLAFESIPALHSSARKQRDEAAAALADATSQIETLSEYIAQRKERIKTLPVSTLFKAHAKEIEELNAGTSDYSRGVNDRPKRVNERDEAIQLAEAGWKGFWPHHPVTEAEHLRTVYSRKTEIFGLITEHARLTTGLTQAEDELRIGNEERERLREEIALHSDPPDPATLVATIEQAKSLGDTDYAIARLTSDIERFSSAATRDMRALFGWSGSIQELETLKTPLLTTIDQYLNEWETITAARRKLTSRLSEVTEAIRDKQIEVDRLAPQIGKAGENELTEVRVQRDELWQLIRKSVFDKTLSIEEAQKTSGASAPLSDVFAERLLRADQIADIRFAYAKDVAIYDRLVKEIASARVERERIEEELLKLESKNDELQQRWRGEWAALGSMPLSPAEMREWMQLRHAVLDRLDQVRDKENELNLLRERAAMAGAQISIRLAECRSQAHDNDSLGVLLKVAEGFAKELEKHRRDVDVTQRRLQSLSLEKRQGKVHQCKSRLAEWSKNWSPFLSAMLLPESSTPDQVGEALAVLEKVFDHLKDADRLQYRVKRISENIDLFDNRASQLVSRLDPSLSSISANAAVTQLHLRLVEIGKAESESIALEAQNSKDEAVISACKIKAQAALATLKTLKELANCDNDQKLEGIITAAEQKSAKHEEYDRIAVGLIERNAVPDVTQVEDEASKYDLDTLQSEIMARENRRKAVEDEVFNTGSKYGKLLEEFERLQSSDESALQAQKAEDALARLRPAVAQYLRLRLASEVLERAIESYRQKHQGPILNRASELFSKLTVGDHRGLTTSFGDDDKPVLVAIRENGEHVEVVGLSDGTRDQLYLALRLAAIEHHVETVAPCPVILDDILINSDDARASAALQVIGDLAKYTQVLFFTHHRRLAELGIKAGAQIIELDSLKVPRKMEESRVRQA